MPSLNLKCKVISRAARGRLLVDDLRRPRYWATIWADVLKAHVGNTTRGKYIASVERFYQSSDEVFGIGALDRILANLDMPLIESALTSHLSCLRNDAINRGINNNKIWETNLGFVSDVTRHLSTSLEENFGHIQSRLLRIERLYSQLAPTQTTSPAVIRALPATVVEELHEIFLPTSPINPFRSEDVRWRNFLIFLLMLHHGLRRGEIGILPADAVKVQYDFKSGSEKVWLNVFESPYEDEDDRYDVPSLKTANSRRQLPLTEEIYSVYITVVENYRIGTGHSYLFSSQKNKPISLKAIHSVIQTANQQLSPFAKNLLVSRRKPCVSAHDLRHTSAVARLARYVESGDDLDLAIEKLRVFFGWSRHSRMPGLYARAYFESDSGDMWSETYDQVVASLRSVLGK